MSMSGLAASLPRGFDDSSVGVPSLAADSAGESPGALPSSSSTAKANLIEDIEDGMDGMDFLWASWPQPAAAANCCQRLGFFSISFHDAEKASKNEAIWPKNCSGGGRFACAFSEMLKNFCTSMQSCIASSSSRFRVAFSCSKAATRFCIRPFPSESSSSCCVSRCINSHSFWKLPMAALRTVAFSREASWMCCKLPFKSCKNAVSEERMVRQRKCSVDTAPVLKEASVMRDSMPKPRTVPSRASSTPWLMKLPTRRMTLSSSRNCVLALASSAAERSAWQRCNSPE
mmetsp:Transcript_43309/g.116786  ORF Transcript_43309/g.116786 Transcript_43309/m.116786 type:complete len:287 (-) Transcript_43309:545-1405(-)